MDNSNSENKSSFSEIIFDFNEENQKIFPHDIGFPKDLSKHSNNYFNATFHCLTNIYDLTYQILDSSNKDGTENPYIIIINKIITVIKDNKKGEKDRFKYYLEALNN
jgi:hypothetical protein